MVTVSGLLLVVMLLANRPVQRALVEIGQRQTRKRLVPRLEQDVNELFAVGDDYVIAALRIADDPGPTVRSLRGLDEAFSGVEVLGVRQSTGYFGKPPVDLELAAGDEIVVYGRRGELEEYRDGGRPLT